MRAMAAFSRRRPSAARPASAPLSPPAGPGAERPAGTVPKGRGRKAERLPGREAARNENGAASAREMTWRAGALGRRGCGVLLQPCGTVLSSARRLAAH
jgi:hypothetical protein